MTTPIHNWFDGCLLLRLHALDEVGAIALDAGERWPRTTGTQVMAIATAFTPAVRANAGPRVLRAWRAMLTDISLDGLPRPDDTYEHNREFWRTLETVALYLDDLAVPCPPQRAWDGLLSFLSTNSEARRNAGPSGDGPFKHFDGVQTFDDLYNAQFKYLRDLRGVDTMKPDAGAPGVERPIPRTTNGDVIALADYWTKQLDDAKRIMGTDGVSATWRAADGTADVDHLAAPAAEPERRLREEQRVLARAAADRDPCRGRGRGAEQVGCREGRDQGQRHAPARYARQHHRRRRRPRAPRCSPIRRAHRWQGRQRSRQGSALGHRHASARRRRLARRVAPVPRPSRSRRGAVVNEVALVLNPPRFVRFRRPPTRRYRSPSRVWPLASINGRSPVVLDDRCADARGVELAYPRIDATDAIASCPIGTPNGTATHLMPAMTAALAVDDGEVAFAGWLGDGLGLIIDHGNGWASHYANLQSIVAIRTDLYRPREQHVRAGEAIGYVGAPEPDAFKRLHFELWERDRDRSFVPIDPRPHFATWKVLEHYSAFTPAPPTAVRTEAA